MKIRTDFVTNSSSSSFIILGIPLDTVLNNTYLSNAQMNEMLKTDKFLTIDDFDEYGFYVNVNNTHNMVKEFTINELKDYFMQYIQDKFNITTLSREDIEYDNIVLRRY